MMDLEVRIKLLENDLERANKALDKFKDDWREFTQRTQEAEKKYRELSRATRKIIEAHNRGVMSDIDKACNDAINLIYQQAAKT